MPKTTLTITAVLIVFLLDTKTAGLFQERCDTGTVALPRQVVKWL